MLTQASTTSSRYIEHALEGLVSLRTLPQVAASALKLLSTSHLNTPALADLIELDPALTARILALVSEQNSSFADGVSTVQEVLASLPDSLIRDAVLSVQVHTELPNQPVFNLAEWTRYNLAVTFAAAELAERVLDTPHRPLARTAALLHDIGKLALCELMPRSLVTMAEQSRQTRTDLLTIEQQQLGLDHAVIAKRLALRWKLPDVLIPALWLQGSDPDAFAGSGLELRLARILRLSVRIAEHAGIGRSGSYAPPECLEPALKALSIPADALDDIFSRLPDLVANACETLGLETPDAPGNYSRLMQETTSRLARENSDLARENRDLQTRLALAGFSSDFLGALGSSPSLHDTIGALLRAWRDNFRTGPVTVILTPPGSETTAAANFDLFGHFNTALINLPEDTSPLDAETIKTPGLYPVAGSLGWFFDQVNWDINPESSTLVPCIDGSTLLAIILFEPRPDADTALTDETLQTAVRITCRVLGMTDQFREQTRLAEDFAALIGRLRKTTQSRLTTRTFDAIAEFSAGAAHELNNPLSIISGRAQLLSDTETNEDKKRILNQIQERASDISRLINGLMAFARPQPPVPVPNTIQSLADAALADVRAHADTGDIHIRTAIPADLPDVNVDARQAVQALGHILLNAIEASEQDQPVSIEAESIESASAVALRIIDTGPGMNPQTLEKALQPFFSSKTAGRKTGLGLPIAKRLIELNRGTLDIESRPGQGTTVTVILPVSATADR